MTKVALLLTTLPYEARRLPPFQITVPLLTRVARLIILSAEPVRFTVAPMATLYEPAIIPPDQLKTPLAGKVMTPPERAPPETLRLVMSMPEVVRLPPDKSRSEEHTSELQ